MFEQTQDNRWHVKYRQHLKDAKQRGIESYLSFEDYLLKASEAGLTKPEQIGKEKDQFVLGRYTDQGPYTKESCRFITASENLKEAFANGRHDAWIAARQGINKENSDWAKNISKTLTGRTKETHASVAAVSKALRGRTKETHDYLKRQSERQLGQTKETSEMYRKGALTRTGRTKETHEGIARAAEKMRGRTKSNHAGVALRAAKLTGRTKETHEYIARMAEALRGRTAKTHAYIAEAARKTGEAHRGRSAKTHEYIKNRVEKLSRSFLMYSRNGRVYSAKNVRAFADEHGLDSSTLSKVLGGKQPATHGWTGRYTSELLQVDTSRPTYVVDVPDAFSKIWVPVSLEQEFTLDAILDSAFECIQNKNKAKENLLNKADAYSEFGDNWNKAFVDFGISLMTTLNNLKLYNENGDLDGLGYVIRKTRTSLVVAYFI